MSLIVGIYMFACTRRALNYAILEDPGVSACSTDAVCELLIPSPNRVYKARNWNNKRRSQSGKNNHKDNDQVNIT